MAPKSLKRNATEEAVQAFEKRMKQAKKVVEINRDEKNELARACTYDVGDMVKAQAGASLINAPACSKDGADDMPKLLLNAKYAPNTSRQLKEYVKSVCRAEPTDSDSLDRIFEVVASNLKKATSLHVIVGCLQDFKESDDLLPNHTPLKNLVNYGRLALIDELWELSAEEIAHAYQAQPSVCLGRPFLDNLAQCVRGAGMDSLDWGELGAKSIAIKAKVQVKLEMVRLEVELKDFQTALPRAIMLSDDGIWQMKPLEEDEPEIAFPGTCHGNPIEIIANALGMQDFNV